MANEFVRNTTDLNSAKEIPLTITEENDLVSNDEKQHFIRRKDDYHCLTDNVKSMKLNGKELKPDLIKNQVKSPNLAEEVNGVKVSSNGKVTIDTGVMTVNGQEPDETGNVSLKIEKPYLYVTQLEMTNQSLSFNETTRELKFIAEFNLSFYSNINRNKTVDLRLPITYENAKGTPTTRIMNQIVYISSLNYITIEKTINTPVSDGDTFYTNREGNSYPFMTIELIDELTENKEYITSFYFPINTMTTKLD